MLTSKFNPNTLVEIKTLELPFLTIYSIHLLKYVIFKDIDTGLLKVMDLFVNNEFILVNICIWIFDWYCFLHCIEKLSPVVHYWIVLFLVRKRHKLLVSVFPLFVFLSFLFLNLLLILFKFHKIFCLSNLIDIFIKRYLRGFLFRLYYIQVLFLDF